jgi:hypothetical protein
MKHELALVLFAATSLSVSVGCSSSPLAPGTEEPSSVGTPSGAGTGTPATGTGTPATSAPNLSSDWVDYPPGPYGTARGATIANLEFLGWQHPDVANYDTTAFEKVRLSDFYNPDGRSDVKLLVVNASAVWCSVCRTEYEDMFTNKTYATFNAKGVQILGTLFQDAQYFPAQPADLMRWGSVGNHAVSFPLVLDPGFKMGAYFDSDATPLNMVIDVRTMTIVYLVMGYPTDYWTTTVQGLLDKM